MLEAILNDIADLANALIVASWDLEAEDPVKPCPDSWLKETMR